MCLLCTIAFWAPAPFVWWMRWEGIKSLEAAGSAPCVWERRLWPRKRTTTHTHTLVIKNVRANFGTHAYIDHVTGWCEPFTLGRRKRSRRRKSLEFIALGQAHLLTRWTWRSFIQIRRHSAYHREARDQQIWRIYFTEPQCAWLTKGLK
jgi:hypothetical protein